MSRSKRKVLYVCHNHPDLYPGGAEAYALELYQSMRASDEFEPLLLARIGSTSSAHPGTPFSSVNGDPNQTFVYADAGDFDFLFFTKRNKDLCTTLFRDYLLAHRPDVVHFQHTLFLGIDLIRQARNVLPGVPIVYTLHEYLPICHRSGQMVRTVNDEELCTHESPRRCHECFPDISPQTFFMRKRFIQSHLSLVDRFIAPSRFLLERYVEWGIPREKIIYDDYGRVPVVRASEKDSGRDSRRPRNRFGFFGQFNPFKGLDVALRAMKLLEEEGVRRRSRSGPTEEEPHLWVHGANLELQTGTFQKEIKALFEATRRNVTLVGRYDHRALPRLMAAIDWVVVPSIWWENSPLVIQEAFLHGRPVICSDIGGMAEKVRNSVNGLHFAVADPADLARTLRRATSTPGLWEELCDGIPRPYLMREHTVGITRLYEDLLRSTSSKREVATCG